VVALFDSRCAETFPDILPVDRPGHLQRHLQAATLYGKIKPCLLILHKVQSDLWITLLLKVSDDALTDEVGATDDLEHLVIVLPNQRELEPVLCRVYRDRPRLGGAVEAVDDLALDAGEIDGLLERLDDPVVALRQGVFDVVERGVDEDTTVVPCGGFDSDRLVNQRALTERLVRDRDGYAQRGTDILLTVLGQ
jgi:hypothetical protein